MNLRRITARTAVAGVTTALAAGALVGINTTAANAATVTNTYTCSIPQTYSGDFAMTVSGELPVPQYWAGAAVPKGLLNITADATVPADAAGLLATFGVTGAKSADYAIDLGSASVPVPIEGDFSSDGTTTTWHATGSNNAFTTPKPGQTDGLLPQSFTLQTTNADGDNVAPLNCVLKEGETAQTLASIQLLKQKSATTAPAKATAKKGKVAKLPVSVKSTSLNVPVTGKVVAKEGKKIVGKGTLKKGKATLNLGKKLTVGKHKITVTYLGIPSVGASSAKTVLTVKKK